MSDEWITSTEAATLCGLVPRDFRARVEKAYAPAPDAQRGRVRLWRRSTIVRWNTHRRRFIHGADGKRRIDSPDSPPEE
jgi:hypothetical protein